MDRSAEPVSEELTSSSHLPALKVIMGAMDMVRNLRRNLPWTVEGIWKLENRKQLVRVSSYLPVYEALYSLRIAA